jgi:uncharacterized iron-regulated membrane protein
VTFRDAIIWLHRWIGLVFCVVLAIVGGTGVVMVWDAEPTFVTKVAGRLHDSIALGRMGAWIVIAATMGAAALQISGFYLWWKRKALRVRFAAGWKRTMFDLHHTAGIIAFPLMLLLAVTALVMFFGHDALDPETRRLNNALHTGREFPVPIKLVYVAGTLGFLVQGVTGVVMWWPRR